MKPIDKKKTNHIILWLYYKLVYNIKETWFLSQKIKPTNKRNRLLWEHFFCCCYVLSNFKVYTKIKIIIKSRLMISDAFTDISGRTFHPNCAEDSNQSELTKDQFPEHCIWGMFLVDLGFVGIIVSNIILFFFKLTNNNKNLDSCKHETP